MDESHRLLNMPMPENYDRNLFNTLYKETKSLRKKLAFEIDGRKYGIDQTEVLSCFDVKFLYIFNKYYGNPKLKGYIISGLRMFKAHSVKGIYSKKNLLHQTDDITEQYNLYLPDEDFETQSEHDQKLEEAKAYLKTILSEDAYFLFEIDLNPPPYILKKLAKLDTTKIPKIPADIIADFLGIVGEDISYYIENLRKEIKDGIKQANFFFSH